VKAELARLGAAANDTPDATFFFTLSSHGSMWSGLVSDCPQVRATSSVAALGEGGGENGLFDDCELGNALNAHVPDIPAVVIVDCSFCGGFSDSLTAVSGTVEDGAVVEPSGILADNRIVITGCAITTECFGSADGGNPFRLFHAVLDEGVADCDGWTAPSFPEVQGLDLPVRGTIDGRCTVSEMFFAAVWKAYSLASSSPMDDVISIQQQFRIKYGFASLDEDIPVL
jgi:hypothetical protein